MSDTLSNLPAGRVRTRYAPSPTGLPHVGNLRTALFSYLFAKRHGGDFVLRVEDTDQSRLQPGALTGVIESLAALGVRYDEGPSRESVDKLDKAKYGDVPNELMPATDGAYGPYFQSQRLPRYHEIVSGLLDDGKAYYAFETKEELDAQRAKAEALKRPFVYNRKFRDYPLAEARARIASGEEAVVRFKMPTEGVIKTRDYLRGVTAWDAETQDDFVILKADGFPPYHLAVVVDDHDMQISHALRGEEWLSSSPKHVMLFDALGWEPPVFIHTPYVLGPDGKKLSKRTGAKPVVGTLYDSKTNEAIHGYVDYEGVLPEALVNYLSLVGWSPGDDREIMPLEEIIAAFDLDGIGKSGGIFDLGKMGWMNGVYIRALSKEDLATRILPFLQRGSGDKPALVGANPTDAEKSYIADIAVLEQEKYKTLADAPALLDFFFPLVCEYEPKSVAKWLKNGTAYLSDVRAGLETLTDWSTEAIEAAVRDAGAKNNREKGELTHPVRVAVSGREQGPGLFDMMHVLGRDRVLARLERVDTLDV